MWWLSTVNGTRTDKHTHTHTARMISQNQIESFRKIKPRQRLNEIEKNTEVCQSVSLSKMKHRQKNANNFTSNARLWPEIGDILDPKSRHNTRTMKSRNSCVWNRSGKSSFVSGPRRRSSKSKVFCVGKKSCTNDTHTARTTSKFIRLEPDSKHVFPRNGQQN